MSALKKMVLLLTAVAVSVPLWAKVELEYFYADDGTLTGRAVNGVRQNFVYDKRGQLLAVKDARGNDIERYVYDPAGNILSKTVGGVTTKYTYDKANQLLTSTRNGKVTRYEYDAAGRLHTANNQCFAPAKFLENPKTGNYLEKLNYGDKS